MDFFMQRSHHIQFVLILGFLAIHCGPEVSLPDDLSSPDPTTSPSCNTAWYLDEDSDGVGVNEFTVTACAAPDGYAAEAGDCRDDAPDIYPGAEEACDGLDNNCDSQVDEGCETPTSAPEPSPAPDPSPTPEPTAEPSLSPEPTAEPSLSPEPTAEPTAEPSPSPDPYPTQEPSPDPDSSMTPEPSPTQEPTGSPEPTPEQNTSPTPRACDTIWYLDADGDEYGGPEELAVGCDPPEGSYSTVGTDCDDSDASVHPGAVEACNGQDDDCDGVVDNACDFSCENLPCPGGGWDVDTLELYVWLEEEYYVYYYTCQDCLVEVYTLDCQYVCSPWGGLAGQGDYRCPTFKDEAVLTATLCEGENSGTGRESNWWWPRGLR